MYISPDVGNPFGMHLHTHQMHNGAMLSGDPHCMSTRLLIIPISFGNTLA